MALLPYTLPARHLSRARPGSNSDRGSQNRWVRNHHSLSPRQITHLTPVCDILFPFVLTEGIGDLRLLMSLPKDTGKVE